MHGQRLFAWTLPLEFQTRPVSIYLVTLSMVTYYYSGKALEFGNECFYNARGAYGTVEHCCSRFPKSDLAFQIGLIQILSSQSLGNIYLDVSFVFFLLQCNMPIGLFFLANNHLLEKLLSNLYALLGV